MHEPLASIIISLLAIILIALLWHGFLLLRIARSLEQPVSKRILAAESEAPSTNPETPPVTAFDRFLAEDPARQQLGKKEQAAAYRVWRKEQGLTWNQ